MSEKEHWEVFGEWVAYRRDDRGLTQDQAALEARVSKATWFNLEHGGREIDGVWVVANPTRPTLFAVARALGVKRSEVLRKAGRKVPPWLEEEEARDEEAS